jgi:hypothetical protein
VVLFATGCQWGAEIDARNFQKNSAEEWETRKADSFSA